MPDALPRTFTVGPSAFPNPTAAVHEGWMLKKRRKKMQGFARRYFVLYESGVLAYAFEPGKPSRDQIQLQQASIATSRNTRDVHVDSGNATFHMKCLDTTDFDKWMTAFRQFVAGPNDPRSLGRKSSVSRAQSRLGQVNKTSVVIEEMGTTISELESAIEALGDGGALKRVPSRNRDKSKEGKEHASMFGLFGKKGHHHGLSPNSANGALPDESDSAREEIHRRLQNALGSLKLEHSALVRLVASLSFVDVSATPTLHGSPMPAMSEESERSTTPKSYQHHAVRHSTAASIISSTASEWFDAMDEPLGEAYELDNDEQPSQSSSSSRLQVDQTVSQMSTPTPAASEAGDDGGSDSEDEYEEEEQPKPPSVHSPKTEEVRAIVRRQALPSGPVGDEGSLFTVLKKNIGKDLSAITLPVSFNEPLSLLQRAAEEVEYYDLLTKAADSQDHIERLCYVAAFAVSGYAHTRHRSSRKGFNPLLAETFEDPRMKLIAEKVSHRPVIMAYHAEGPGWEQYSTVSGKTKFWGKSLEIIPTGVNHARIGDELFEWRRPSSFMRNIMMGTKYLEHTGKMTIECTTSKARCVIEFKENGYWDQSNQVIGTVYSPEGKVVSSLEGKWDQSLQRKIDSAHLHVLWRMEPFPKHSQQQYGLTSFAMTLNEITPDLAGRLPPTDSRLRPDIRALEEGRMDDAEQGKEMVEDTQRQRRVEGNERAPRWFKQEGDEWIYQGGYWEAREKGWTDVEPLW